MSISVFGEITSGVTDSKYTWANAVTLTLLNKVKEYDEQLFEHLKESDIVNAGLVFLNLFFNIHIDNECKEETEKVIRDLTFDENEFKDFLTIAINHGKMHNIMLNDGIFVEGDDNGF